MAPSLLVKAGVLALACANAAAAATVYTLEDTYEGENFFSKFNFNAVCSSRWGPSLKQSGRASMTNLELRVMIPPADTSTTRHISRLRTASSSGPMPRRSNSASTPPMSLPMEREVVPPSAWKVSTTTTAVSSSRILHTCPAVLAVFGQLCKSPSQIQPCPLRVSTLTQAQLDGRSHELPCRW